MVCENALSDCDCLVIGSESLGIPAVEASRKLVEKDDGSETTISIAFPARVTASKVFFVVAQKVIHNKLIFLMSCNVPEFHHFRSW